MTVTVTFVGTGDAFGTGGRHSTCILVDTPALRFAIDFGASSIVALKALGIEHTTIDLILLTHYHGDHAGGLPAMLLDAMLGARRTSPLTIAGPPGLPDRLRQFSETLYPGSSRKTPRFPLDLVEIEPMRPREVLGLRVSSYPALHTPETIPTSVRIDTGEKVIAYTGDTAWTEHLPALAEGSDLMIAECYGYSKAIPFHLNYGVISEWRDELRTRRLVLTHMGPEMLENAAGQPIECAHDGMVIRL